MSVAIPVPKRLGTVHRSAVGTGPRCALCSHSPKPDSADLGCPVQIPSHSRRIAPATALLCRRSAPRRLSSPSEHPLENHSCTTDTTNTPTGRRLPSPQTTAQQVVG